MAKNVKPKNDTVQVENIYEIPSIYASYVYATLLSNGLSRLTFCEQVPDTGKAMPRAALIMTPVDVKGLRDLLSAQIEHMDKQAGLLPKIAEVVKKTLQ